MNLPPFARWNNPVGNNYPRKLHFRRIKFPAVKVLRLRCWGSLQIIAQQLGNFSCRASTLSLLTVHKHGAAVFFCHSRTPRRVHAPDRGNLLLSLRAIADGVAIHNTVFAAANKVYNDWNATVVTLPRDDKSVCSSHPILVIAREDARHLLLSLRAIADGVAIQ